MVEFGAKVTYFNAAGAATDVTAPAGGVTGLGRLIRAEVVAAAPKPRDVTTELVRVLKTGRSYWPALSRTRNIGPWATNTSVFRFRGAQGRSSTGRFQSWQLLNDARNASGRPYAGFVDSGIGAGPVRYAANYRAVERTWALNRANILRTVRGRRGR